MPKLQMTRTTGLLKLEGQVSDPLRSHCGGLARTEEKNDMNEEKTR